MNEYILCDNENFTACISYVCKDRKVEEEILFSKLLMVNTKQFLITETLKIY